VGGVGLFLQRTDVWELPFLRFRWRRVRSVFELHPCRSVQRFSLISRGSRPVPWIVNELEVSETDGSADVAFRPVGDSSFGRLEDAVDRRPATFARAPTISSGTRLTIELAAPRDRPFRVEMSHGEEHDAFPYSFVVQEEPGGYFRGNLNDPSYIPFRKSFRTSMRVSGVAPQALPLAVGLALLAGLALGRPPRCQR
jgi:hypothetical protein